MAERKQSPSQAAQNVCEKGLPSNLEAEKLVLGSILLDGSQYVQAAAVLQPEDFSLEKHRIILKRMGEMQERGAAIDRVTVAEELMRNAELEACDGLAYLISLDDGLPQIANLGEYIKIVKEKSILRRTIFQSQKLMNSVLSGLRPNELQETAEEILMGLGENQLDNDGPQTIAEALRELPGGPTELLDPTRREKGIPTGFYKFDEMTGGLYKGDLIILAARPSMGKTALALNIADHVACKAGAPVMIFSLEMSKRSLIERMMCAKARVDSQRYRLGYLNRDERPKLMHALSDLNEAPLYIDDTSAVTLPNVHAKLRKHLASKKKLGLVVIDYLQLMSAGRNFESKNQEVTYLSRGLKLMAKEMQVPMLVLSQLSRAPELRKGSHKPQLSDLRESGSIEQDCDVCAFIFRPEVYAPKERDDLRGQAELILAKQRNGPVGTINLVFLHNLTKFENRAEDMDEPAPLLKTGRGKDDAASDYTD